MEDIHESDPSAGFKGATQTHGLWWEPVTHHPSDKERCGWYSPESWKTVGTWCYAEGPPAEEISNAQLVYVVPVRTAAKGLRRRAWLMLHRDDGFVFDGMPFTRDFMEGEELVRLNLFFYSNRFWVEGKHRLMKDRKNDVIDVRRILTEDEVIASPEWAASIPAIPRSLV